MHTFKQKLIQCVISVYCLTLYTLELVVDLTNRNNQPKTPILRNISKSAHTSTATKKVMAKNLRKTKRERIIYIQSQKFEFSVKIKSITSCPGGDPGSFFGCSSIMHDNDEEQFFESAHDESSIDFLLVFFPQIVLGKGIRQNYRQCQSIKSCQQ